MQAKKQNLKALNINWSTIFMTIFMIVKTFMSNSFVQGLFLAFGRLHT